MEPRLKRFVNRNSISDIAQAKRTAEKFGYEVELDTGIQRPYRHVYKNNTEKRSDVETALKTATDAGYTVRKTTTLDIAKDTAERAGYNIVRKAPVNDEPKAPVNDEPKTATETPEDAFYARVDRFMGDE